MNRGLQDIIKRNRNRRLFLHGQTLKKQFKLPTSFLSPSIRRRGKNGDVDITNVKAVAKGIAKYLNGYKIIINKSTVPIGMGDVVAEIIQKYNPTQAAFDVVSNARIPPGRLGGDGSFEAGADRHWRQPPVGRAKSFRDI